MSIFVGNISWDITEFELREIFEAFGVVSSVTIMKGHGFIEMQVNSEAEAAVLGLNNTIHGDRNITVLEAMPLNRQKATGVRKRKSFRVV